MERIFSTRMDDSVYHKITDLSRRMHTSKKSVVAQAIECLCESVDGSGVAGILERTCGAWHRSEPAGATVEKARAALRRSMERNRR